MRNTSDRHVALSATAALAMSLIVVGVGLSIANQSLREEVAERQRVINEGMVLGQINSRLVNSLAVLATQGGDTQVRAILAQQGITATITPTASPATRERSTVPPK